LRLLLDTQVLLWWLTGHRRLGAASRRTISDPASLVHVSAATYWEVAIKKNLGRLDLGDVDIADEVDAAGLIELPITGRHALRAGALPRHHEDPFDRMLVAQAVAEGLTLVTSDAALSRYDVAILKP
jgi:PIN domain nuclease of toxin-antitoxin system